ncbi:MAG: [protein-PII] uridylyltransferase [Bacteroidota bacterium]|nr:[protein-PII] uridylyltransferase [Bacteroidota bacterium]
MTIKEFFQQEYDNIFRFHRCGARGIDVAAELSELVDTTLTKLWYELPEESRTTFAVVGLGGYGRYEMSPHSDVDVMILFADEQTKKNNSETAQKFLHSLWNVGFDIGHSVRTIGDCLNLYQTDVDVWASILESRYVCGNRAIVEQFADALLPAIQKKQDLKFIGAVIAGVDERHNKYEHSVKLLEPNLKNSSGGVRDLHSLVWIFRSSDPKYFSLHPMQTNESGCLAMLEQFREENLISVEEYHELTAAFDFLLRIRHETHYVSEAQNDILEFSKQFAIANGLHFRFDDKIKSVETCMREYFLHARVIYRLNRRLVNQFRRGASASFWSKLREQVLDDYFVIRSGQLHLRNTAKEFSSPADIVRGFYWCGLHSLELSTTVLTQFESLSRNQKFFAVNESSEHVIAEEFLKILRLPANVAATLQAMNDCDILGKILPGWANLVAFFQHSMYHYYTTDAHTLIALEHAENLLSSKSILGEAMRSIEQKELFYLAVLFHDIAKPIGISEHEVRGVEVWRGVQKRWKISDEHDIVAFLIRQHLVMEQIAFRRNTGDAKTIEEFASLFPSFNHLVQLFVLTYADLSAVNKSVWSSWKETLLQELFLKTKRLLLKQPEAPLPVYPKEIQEHIASIANTLYADVFSLQDMEQHLAAISTLETSAIFVRHDESSHSLVTIITRDAQYLLSMLCGVLSANDTIIIDANIFTRNDGVVIDQFRVIDSHTKKELTALQEEKLRKDFQEVLKNHESLNHLFERHQRRWRRRAKPLFHPNIRVDVVFQETNNHTIMDVYAPDMTGFLYKITQTISKQGLQISFAKLATRGDGIVDSFYVTEYGGQKISSREQTLLREKILHTISQLINVQMADS